MYDNKKKFDKSMGQRCPLHILIAEDNPLNQKIACLMLKKMGYNEVDVVDNGLLAVQAIGEMNEQHYDLILMDLRMPEMDGYEATRAILEAVPSECRPSIVALTANALEEDRQACFSAGMDGHIAKPVKSSILAEYLSKIFDIKH